MDYTRCYKDVLRQYSFTDPLVELIRHNENMTYKVTEKGTDHTYLLRIHKPITPNMQGVHNTREAILSELEYLSAWSSQSELPVQTPVSNQAEAWVTTVMVEEEEVYGSVLKWIAGETMSKQACNSEEKVNHIGENMAKLHRFSQSYQPASSFIRPEYGIEWTDDLLTKMRSGEETGLLSSEEFHMIESTFSLINTRMKEWSQTKETWGFIHGDINYSNLILTSKGISFIDFGLSGLGYYMMDVAMGALMTKAEWRDALLSGYTNNMISGTVDIAQLEGFMFLAIMGYYTFLLSQKDKHPWIREHIAGLIEHLCTPFLNGETVFYTV